MGEHQTLFAKIDALSEEFIQKWIDVGNIESPTDCKAGVDAVGEYFAAYAKQMGWDVEVFEQPVSGNCVTITMNGDSPERPMTLSGHIDTVHAVGSFGAPAVRVEGDRIYGPGVTDCKGGCVAALLAMRALADCGFQRRPVRLILQSDEERNSRPSGKATINYICEKAKGSIGFLNCESTRGNTAVLWRRGIMRFRFTVTGKTIHASRCPEGANAIVEAAQKLLFLEKYKDIDGITFCCGKIEGGESENTVPEKCAFSAEFRFNTSEETAQIEQTVKELAATSFIEGTSTTVEKTGYRPPMEKCERNLVFLDKLNRIYEKTGLPTLTARQSLGGSDAAEVTQAGIPCVDSIGTAGDKIHTPMEYGVLSSLAEAAKRIAAAIYFIE